MLSQWVNCSHHQWDLKMFLESGFYVTKINIYAACRSGVSYIYIHHCHSVFQSIIYLYQLFLHSSLSLVFQSIIYLHHGGQ